MKNVIISDIEDVLENDLESPRKKKKFLADLIGAPPSSVVGNDKRLLMEIETWMNKY